MVSPFPEHRALQLALVSETFPPEINGVAMTLGRIVGAMVRRGHRVEVVRCRLPGERTALGSVAADGAVQVPLASLPIPRYHGLRLGLPCRGYLRHRWSQQRPEVVHIATEGPLGWSALRAATDLGIPVSSSFHTNFDDYARHYGIGLATTPVRWWLRRMHNAAGVTMVPSADLLETLRRDGYRHLMTLGRGVDTELFTPAKRDPALRRAWQVDDDDLLLLHVGRVAPEKDIPLAIQAFDRIRERVPNARLVVVGEGPLRGKLQRTHHHVRFTGALPIERLAAAYASADGFLFPSRSETFGNVLLEAMASGLPTVSFAYAAPRQYVQDGVNGLLAPFDDTDAWLAQALRLATDRELRQRLGPAARTTAATIAWEPVVLRFEQLLRQVADHRVISGTAWQPGGATAAA